MISSMGQMRRVSFVVRVVQGRRGQVSGVIERVATGAKEAFTGMEAVGRVIMLMLQGATVLPGVASGALSRRREKPRLGERPPGRSRSNDRPRSPRPTTPRR
jgi:hypothetical protein